MVELSTKPYLIRAIYEWCADCGYTPYLSVRVDENTRVPMEYVKDGEIVLNVGHGASRNLTISNEIIQFSARFNGVSREIAVPTYTVQGIFARETGKGAFFEVEIAPEQFSLTTVKTENKLRNAELPAKPDTKPGLRLASVSTLATPNLPPDEGAQNATDATDAAVSSATADAVTPTAPSVASNVNSIRTMRSVPNFVPQPAVDAPKNGESTKASSSIKKASSTPEVVPGAAPEVVPGVVLGSATTPAALAGDASKSRPSIAITTPAKTPPDDTPPTAPLPPAPVGGSSKKGGKKSGLRIIK